MRLRLDLYSFLEYYYYKFIWSLVMIDFENMSKRLFAIQRTQVLTSKNKRGERLFSDSYVYAWSKSVYPHIHDHEPDGVYTHSGFDDNFKIKKKTVSSVFVYIDKMLGQRKILTYDEIEKRFSSLDSETLMTILRYIYLSGKMRSDGVWENFKKGRCRSGLDSVLESSLDEHELGFE